MERVVTFGEIMMRLSPPGVQKLVQAENLELTYGGGEANVAVSLANYGLDSVFVTCLPQNPPGQGALNHLRRFGVNTQFISRGGTRLGLYFLEKGASQRPSAVTYDRNNSAIAETGKGDFPWQVILNDARWFHFTGITPALSDSAAEATMEACKIAKNMGVKISCDLNYRKKLWSPQKAEEVMGALMPYVDVAIANEEDAEKVFGIKAGASDVEKAELDEEGYMEVARKLKESFGFEQVAITLRESFSASDNGWSGLLYDGENYYQSRQYFIHVVDRVGGGDAFAAGLIYALLNEWPPRDTIEFAAAASCLKHTVPGDLNMVSVEEVQKLAQGGGSGRVQR